MSLLPNASCFIKRASYVLCFVFGLGHGALVFSLSSDNKQKVNIVSDHAIYNYRSGVNFFEGHVKVVQGTTHLMADRLITKNNKQHKIQEIIAYGLKQTAHYWTLPQAGEKEVHAKANLIKYYPIESNVVLQHNVLVMQGENSFHGELIFYNMNDETITVPASKNGRAVVVYNPDS